MAYYACDNCGKTVDRGHKVSHAKNRTKTLRKPNLHRAKIVKNGEITSVRLCTKCIRRADRPHKQQESKKTSEAVA